MSDPVVETIEETPLVDCPSAGHAPLAERALLGHINLRADPADPCVHEAVRAVMGIDLPLVPDTACAHGDWAALWRGPDEWALTTPSGRAPATVELLAAGLAARHAAVTDLTSGLTVIEVHGPRAHAILAAGCSLDLHRRMFGPGRCAQTLVGKVPALIHQYDDRPTFDLIVRRSYADHLWRWLVDAARTEPAAR